MDNNQVIDLMDETVQPKTREINRNRRIKPKHHRTVKEEMQTLHLIEDSQKQIMDTLRYIHGPNFELTDISKYKNKKSRFKDKFWEDAGNLVIKSAFDYSQNTFVLTPKEEFRMYSVNKLKSYGFHENHCVEALEYFKDDIDSALKILYTKYHRIHSDTSDQEHDHGLTVDELLQQRIDEKDVLQSIYDNAFSEKIPNKLWILTFQLNYLIEQYSNKKHTENLIKIQNTTKKIDKCRNFLRTGQCKYGNKCRFSHEIETVVKAQHNETEDYKFNLEIHFDSNSMYPYEPPTMILLTTNFTAMPKNTLLYICERLIDEAKNLANDGIVSIYSICELLQHPSDITDYLNTTKVRFIDEYESLFGGNELDNGHDENSLLPTHYERNIKIKKQSNKNYEHQDALLFKEFKNKQNNSKYQTFLDSRKSLPAWNKRDDILNIIEKHQVILISGETGCGKSTQIPQYILDNWLTNDDGKHIEVICTQPRRLSAIGVAERVASERIERIGGTIGYQIRLETKVSDSTRLIFCTTGILLMRLQSDPYLNSITHVIVDEVHERSDESDFLLLILRRILPKRPDLKIILMSATLNAKLFSDYFGGIPIIEIPGRTFPVQQYFLEDILEETGYVLEENSPFARTDVKTSDLEEQLATCEVLKDNQEPSSGIKDYKLALSQILARYREYSMLTCKNLYLMDMNKINLELIEAALMWIIFGNHKHPKEGTILIFLPGYAEITALLEFLSNNTNFSTRQKDFLILPLHSSLSNEDQSAIFKKPKNGARKIILSTNIAETSITIDDCVFVIDCGKMKEKRFDSNKNMESLDTVWISRANAMQRRGRAGRVMPGVCIHLYTSFTFKQFIAQPVPELHRIPLEQIILRIKVLPNFMNTSIQSVLDETIEPPATENTESSIYRLQDVGALDEDEELTPLGHHLATLPVDVRIGKIMLYGAIFCCVDSSLTIAACLSYKSPFVAPFLQKKEGDAKKKEFISANSDQLTVLKAYKKWKFVADRGSQASYNFAQENYLSQRTLITLSDIKHQLLDLLVNIGFVPIAQKIQRRTGQDRVLEMTGTQMNENGENSKLLAGVLCAALYPNIIKVLTPGKSYQKCIGGALPTIPDHEDLKFVTLEDGYVAIHSSSVNSKIGAFPSPYLLYQEKVKTSRLFVRETCMVPPLCLALFAGCDLHIEVHSGMSIISLDDGWIIFRTETHEVAEMLKAIRIELNKLLEEKIKDPSLNLLNLNQGKRIISTIINIISVNS